MDNTEPNRPIKYCPSKYCWKKPPMLYNDKISTINDWQYKCPSCGVMLGCSDGVQGQYNRGYQFSN